MVGIVVECHVDKLYNKYKEDITERFIPLFQDNKDSDTIKRIKLPSHEPLFVIGILEHESEVSYIASFKMLQYMTLVLADHVKENDKRYYKDLNENGRSNLIPSKAKGSKFPPVLPVIFYDGVGKWTSEIKILQEIPKDYIEKLSINVPEHLLKILSDVITIFLKKIDVPKQDIDKIAEKIELAKELLKLGDSIDKIQIVTKLPEDTIQKLKDEIKNA